MSRRPAKQLTDVERVLVGLGDRLRAGRARVVRGSIVLTAGVRRMSPDRMWMTFSPTGARRYEVSVVIDDDPARPAKRTKARKR